MNVKYTDDFLKMGWIGNTKNAGEFDGVIIDNRLIILIFTI